MLARVVGGEVRQAVEGGAELGERVRWEVGRFRIGQRWAAEAEGSEGEGARRVCPSNEL